MGADMKGDIFWRNTTTGEFAMWVMNGTTIAQNVSFGHATPQLDVSLASAISTATGQKISSGATPPATWRSG